jgi:hypothetical protein
MKFVRKGQLENSTIVALQQLAQKENSGKIINQLNSKFKLL